MKPRISIADFKNLCASKGIYIVKLTKKNAFIDISKLVGVEPLVRVSVSSAGQNKINVIKEIRACVGNRLAEAKAVSEGTLTELISVEVANRLIKVISKAGGISEIVH